MTIAGVLFVGVIVYGGILRPPQDFPEGEIITIPSDTSLAEVVDGLESAGVVRSAWWLRVAVTLLDGETGVRAGDYYFRAPQSLVVVARRLVDGSFGLEPIRVRVVEGMTATQIATHVAKQLPRVDREQLLELMLAEEGYLFPDTYFFLPSTAEEAVARAMRNNFDLQVARLNEEITAFGRPLADVVTMASIIEKEAHNYRNKRIIAGILWKRIERGMLLQVDVSFGYLLGKGTSQITRADLAIDSPYNTYKYPGLPPGPISNPSLASLKAAASPIETPYFFFLDGRDGITYFSATYEEHLEYKRKYLD